MSGTHGEIDARELASHGNAIVERVARGEALTVTRAGIPVAQLRPLPRAPVRCATLLKRWKPLPTVGPAGLRDDIDTAVDPSL